MCNIRHEVLTSFQDEIEGVVLPDLGDNLDNSELDPEGTFLAQKFLNSIEGKTMNSFIDADSQLEAFIVEMFIDVLKRTPMPAKIQFIVTLLDKQQEDLLRKIIADNVLYYLYGVEVGENRERLNQTLNKYREGEQDNV